LQAALQRRAEAAATVDRLEAVLPAARTALASAQVKHDAATTAMQESETGAVMRLAASLTGARAEAAGITADAARARLRLAEDALHAARGAKALIEDKVSVAGHPHGVDRASCVPVSA
jgi:hypothetical protein